MTSLDRRLIISRAMQPREGMQVVERDGKQYLLRNDAWFTGIQHSQAEFSDFFLGLKEGRIIGHFCSECRNVIVPPFQQRCPTCDFREMKRVILQDTGVMLATPVIVAFAPSRFKDEVPFGIGYALLDTKFDRLTDSAILLRVKTTHGAIRPGIYQKGTPIKVVFAKERRGEILDIFALPQSELTAEQIAKSPLFEDELVNRLGVPVLETASSPDVHDRLFECVGFLNKLAERIAKSVRAQKDLANWQRLVRVETVAGYNFEFVIYNNTIKARWGEIDEQEGKCDDVPINDLVSISLSIPDPNILLAWLRDAMKTSEDSLESPALTDLVLEGKIILGKPELETITRLDRLPRSLRRDGV